jgi:hypothetical protein
MLSIKTVILTKQGKNKIHREILSQHVSDNMICFSLWLKKYTTKLRGLETNTIRQIMASKDKIYFNSIFIMFYYDLEFLD